MNWKDLLKLNVTILGLSSIQFLAACTQKREATNGSDTASAGSVAGGSSGPSSEPFPSSDNSGGGSSGKTPGQTGGGVGVKGGISQKGGLGGWVPTDASGGGSGKIPPNIDPPINENPPPPPGKVWLELKVIQQNYEAWWKNCLTVSVGTDSKFVSCNKDANAIGTTVKLAADLPPACNAVSVKIDTYRNNPGSCSVGSPCNGPYPSTPSWTRTSQTPTSQRYFKVFHRNSALPNDPLWRAEMNENFPTLKSMMESMRNGGKNRMLRAFFEDQPPENLDAAIANVSLAQSKGIDYNDTTFDVSGTDVNFYLNGIGPQGCSDQ